MMLGIVLCVFAVMVLAWLIIGEPMRAIRWLTCVWKHPREIGPPHSDCYWCPVCNCERWM